MASYVDVVNADVAVDDAQAVGVLKRGQYLVGYIEGEVRGQGRVALLQEPVTDRVALHELEHDEVESVVHAGVVDLDDVGMAEPAPGPRGVQEALDGALVPGGFRVKDLDNDLALHGDLDPAVDLAHFVLADVGLDAAPADEHADAGAGVNSVGRLLSGRWGLGDGYFVHRGGGRGELEGWGLFLLRQAPGRGGGGGLFGLLDEGAEAAQESLGVLFRNGLRRLRGGRGRGGRG